MGKASTREFHLEDVLRNTDATLRAERGKRTLAEAKLVEDTTLDEVDDAAVNERSQFDSTAADTKAKLRDASMRAERKITSGHAQHAAEQKKINCGSKRPDPWIEAQHEPDCLWRQDAVDPGAYGPARDVCTCGPICDWPQDDGYGPHEGRILRHRWWVRTPSADPWRRFVWDFWRGWYIKDSRWIATADKIPPPKAVHGTLEPQYDAPISSGGQAAAMRKHMTALGALHGATPGRRPIYSNAAYMDAWSAARARLKTPVWCDHLIGCLEGTDEGVAACRASKKCHYCGAYFVANHGKAKFCSDAHRQRYHHNGPMERPIFECEGLDPPPRWVTPTLVDIGSPHDELCQNRRRRGVDADGVEVLLDGCFCGMRRTGRVGEFVTIRTIRDAKTRPVYTKTEDAQPMAA
jgi:hypothetical protein